MMKTSPIFRKSETGEDSEHGFDPQVDFSQFLEEARNHATEEKSSSIPTLKQGRNEEEKKRKSWKKSLFSWWKLNKKKKPPTEFSSSPHIVNARRGSVSGQIYGSARKTFPEQRVKRPASGPLTGLFTNTRREVMIPYMGLDQLNNPTEPQLYGPVYLVT